jgi:chemotaxis family two-component system sensor kinase Cph1
VRLTWDVRPDSIAMEWLETGGPPVEAPETKGFGTRIIGAIIEGQLGGAARFDWPPGGLRCMLSIPRSDAVKTGEQPSRSDAA